MGALIADCAWSGEGVGDAIDDDGAGVFPDWAFPLTAEGITSKQRPSKIQAKRFMAMETGVRSQ